MNGNVDLLAVHQISKVYKKLANSSVDVKGIFQNIIQSAKVYINLFNNNSMIFLLKTKLTNS